MTSVPDEPTRTISEGDRGAAVQRLQDAYAEGHLAHEELDERLHQVLTARMSGEIVSALASLPEEAPGTTSTIAAASGRIRRRGVWRVPRVLKVESAFGSVDLDLSQAVFEHPALDLELQLGSGRARITVPRDAIVNTEDVRTGWKPVRYNPPPPSPSTGPRIRISGTMAFGRLKIRHARH